MSEQQPIKPGSLRHLKRDIDELYEKYPDCHDAAVAIDEDCDLLYQGIRTHKVCRNSQNRYEDGLLSDEEIYRFNCVSFNGKPYADVGDYLDTIPSVLNDQLLKEENFINHLNSLSVHDAATLLDTQTHFKDVYYYVNKWMNHDDLYNMLNRVFTSSCVNYIIENDFKFYDNKYPRAQIAMFSLEQWNALNTIKLSDIKVPEKEVDEDVEMDIEPLETPREGGVNVREREGESVSNIAHSGSAHAYKEIYTKSQVCLNCDGVMAVDVNSLANDTLFFCNLCGFKFRKF